MRRKTTAAGLPADYMPIRPGEIIKRLSEAFALHCEPFTLPEGRVLEHSSLDGQPWLWFFTSGVFSISRQVDGLQLLTSQASESAMSIYGLIEALDGERLCTLRAESECKGRRLPAHYLMSNDNSVELWRDISQLVAYFVKLAINRDRQLVGVPSYNIIRHQLISLMAYPADVRLKINVQTYISERTRLSRSNTLKILNALNSGGYITVKRGRLLNLKYLPLKF
ncbi:MAG: helix-turn-helix domain-containing protein [Scandinavium sp.]|uniref:helix-turn-helix domain-containing protein n=1 Tax=Scandinavium sp. TaxID=2830653 RepID=UPI003F3454C1